MASKANNTKYVGNCTPSGVIHRAVKVYKMSNAENPVKTGNHIADFAIGRIPLVKNWNQGFNAGKFGFVVQQTYNDTCKRKK